MRFKAFNLRNGIFIWFSYLMRANAKSSLKTCTGKIKVVTLQPNKKTQTNMSIKFDKRNYRKHNDANKRKIKKSLEECGAGRSVLVDADDCLIAGNGVYEQASALGIPTRVIETDGTELVVVKRTDLQTDDPKRKTLALADNATSDNVEWEDMTLTDDFGLDTLSDWDIVIPETLSDEELDNLLVDAPEQEKDPKVTIVIPLCYEDEVEDIKAALMVTLDQWKGCKVK